MKKKILILFFVLVSIVAWAQDTLNFNEKNHKFLFGLSVSSFFSPEVIQDNNNMIINNDKSKLSYGGHFIVNYYFNKNFGITSGFGFLRFQNSFDYVFPIFDNGGNFIKDDTAHWKFNGLSLMIPVNLLYTTNYDKKCNYFINIGANPSYVSYGGDWTGTIHLPKPSSLSNTKAILIYNINLGAYYSISTFKSFISISYFNVHNAFTFHEIDENKGVFTKNIYLLNIGLLF